MESLKNNLSNSIFYRGKFDIQTDNTSVLLQVALVDNVRNESTIQVSSLIVIDTIWECLHLQIKCVAHSTFWK